MTVRHCEGAATAGAANALAAVALWSTNALAARFALAELEVVQVLALQFGGAAATVTAGRWLGCRWQWSASRVSR
jgi:hypothetical protein